MKDFNLAQQYGNGKARESQTKSVDNIANALGINADKRAQESKQYEEAKRFVLNPEAIKVILKEKDIEIVKAYIDTCNKVINEYNGYINSGFGKSKTEEYINAVKMLEENVEVANNYLNKLGGDGNNGANPFSQFFKSDN
ncbi:hypothetical protein [Clostridium perfringens]|uniref:hypothetical protein n=1 Tax=Clostridium perfringens TaxID=1502 RepID=UPI00246986AC|nr:hypothetical protein [Clostridium perfringens]MDH5068064.1 hypothetical protein [Clostridium perfringens]